MRRAAVHVVLPGFLQAEGAVDGQANIRGIFIFLAIVFPPADEPGLHQCSHTGIDGKKWARVYEMRGPIRMFSAPNSYSETQRARFFLDRT